MSGVVRPSRADYSASFLDFLAATDEEVLGHLSRGATHDIVLLQRGAWIGQLPALRTALLGLSGRILLEYSIPRMGRRVDAVLLLDRSVVVVEFKVGETHYTRDAIDQVVNYALDLKNFHKCSHDKSIVPLLVATEAASRPSLFLSRADRLFEPVCANRTDLRSILSRIDREVSGAAVDHAAWLDSGYCPTPTIVEAAQALYRDHSIEEISRSEAGADNLTRTAQTIAEVVAVCRAEGSKAICFVTGVPGAGKTLAGLNIANTWRDASMGEHAVFLSGNGPLVDVLREALARDDVEHARMQGVELTKAEARTKVKAFVQNVHHFRDEYFESGESPPDRIVVFDEAQRAWDKEQTESFMRRKRGVANFGMSEPEFLLSVMNRHSGWAVMICLIGGGQEINTGEAGLAEWFRALHSFRQDWAVYVPDRIEDSEYADAFAHNMLAGIPRLVRTPGLHLATSLRSFRAEKVSDLVKSVLDLDQNKAEALLGDVLPTYPIRVTRNVEVAKTWLKCRARGTERYGMIASSEAQRLRPYAINVKAAVDPVNWFLNGKDDIRSSFFLEDVATEFQVQGLELDWTCVAWDADLRFGNAGWDYHGFSGTSWHYIKDLQKRKYLRNAYRVLLTRARQGMVIFVPTGCDDDETRESVFYDGTYEYLRSLGIPEPEEAELVPLGRQ
ncbi:MAG: DUF2075 domain-containing protein [bacterium]